MGLPSIENFDASFIYRTSENLKSYNGKYEFTMLLNSLLGLIVVPNESKELRDFTFDFWNKKLTDFDVLKQIFANNSVRVLKKTEEIEQRKFFWLTETNNERPIDDVSVEEFLTRMRHSIAHFGIIPLSKPESKSEWCGVILQNFREDEVKNFEVCLMENEIKIFSNFIADKYLATVKFQRL